MQSDDSLATELERTTKSVEYGMPGAKKYLERLKRRTRRRKRNHSHETHPHC